MRRPLSFCAGLVLTLLLALAAIAGPATRTGLFVQALKETVNKPLIQVTDEDLARFGEETMRYLRMEKDAWEPDVPFAIPAAFYGHMAQVRSWVRALPWVFGLGAALVAACVLTAWNRRAFLGGMLLPLGLIALCILWAAIDFDSFWMVLHRLFIPDGIFSAREPVMQLFPLSLFMRYLPWVLAALTLEGLAVWAIFHFTNKGKVS